MPETEGRLPLMLGFSCLLKKKKNHALKFKKNFFRQNDNSRQKKTKLNNKLTLTPTPFTEYQNPTDSYVRTRIFGK